MLFPSYQLLIKTIKYISYYIKKISLSKRMHRIFNTKKTRVWIAFLDKTEINFHQIQMLSILIKSSYSFLHKNRKKIDGWVTKNTKRSSFPNRSVFWRRVRGKVLKIDYGCFLQLNFQNFATAHNLLSKLVIQIYKMVKKQYNETTLPYIYWC